MVPVWSCPFVRLHTVMPKPLSFKTTVSELCLCRRCPRLFAFRLSVDKNARQAGLEKVSFGSAAFCDEIAAPFHRDAAGQNGVKKRRQILELLKKNAHTPNTLKKALLDEVYRNYLSPFLEANQMTPDGEQAETLGNSIMKWCEFLAVIFCGNSGFRDDPQAFLEQVFLPQKKNLKSTYTDADGEMLTVRGQFDCALFDQTANEVLLVAFGCHEETGRDEDLAQRAFDAWLIRESTGLPPRISVLYLEKAKSVRTYSAVETAEAIERLPQHFDTAIQVLRAVKTNDRTIPETDNPHLCNTCPYKKECKS